MKILSIAAIAMAMLAVTTTDILTGRWETKPSPKGNVTGIVFKSDNSFEAYINKKPFVSGKYELKDSIFSFVDNGCDGKRGVYKIIFFSSGDSMRFVPVMDSCEERRNGMIRTVMGKVK
jgi:hypothetical protein